MRVLAVRLLVLSLLWGCSDDDARDVPTVSYKLNVDAAVDAEVSYSSSGRPEFSACLRRAGSFDGPNAYAYTVDWSPAANYLLVGTIGVTRLLKAELARGTVSELATSDMPDSQVYVQWAPDGQYAVSAGQDVRLIRIADESPTISEIARYSGHTGAVIAVAWSRDGSLLLTGAKDESVRVLAVDRERARLEERAVFHGHVGRVFSVAWSPDGKNAVSAGEDGTLRLLAVDAEGGTIRELAQVKGVDWKNSVSWAPDAALVLSGDWGLFNRADMWSIDSTGHFSSQGVLTDFDHVGVQVLRWNSAGNMLAAGAHDGGLQLFAYADHRFQGLGALQNWSYGVHSASWSHDGNHLALSAAFGERILIVDVSECVSHSPR